MTDSKKKSSPHKNEFQKRRGRKASLIYPYHHLGQFLKDRREKRQISQLHIAELAKLKNSQFISNIERGVALPPASLMKLMIQVYKIEKASILEALYKDFKEKVSKKYSL